MADDEGTRDEIEQMGPAFRARLKGQAYSVRLLPHPFTVRVNEEGLPKTPIAPYGAVRGACRLCPALCCRMSVTVSLPDALQYSRTLGVPLFSGLSIKASEHPDHSFRMDADSRWGTEGESWPGRAELELKRRADGRCHAIVDIDGYQRCGVYTARPSFCRTYPVRWTSDVAEGGPPRVRCPVPYGITDDEAETITGEVERSIEWWELHDDIVRTWNESDGPFTIEAFLAFAVPAAARLSGIDAPDALESGSAADRLATVVHASTGQHRPPDEMAPRTLAGLPVLRE